MASEPPLDVTVTQEGLDSLIRAIRDEEDGKELRKDLARGMRDVLKPAAERAKSGIRGMPSQGKAAAPALRTAIAKKIRPEVKLTGRWTGARVRARRTHNVRGFQNAPKRTQRVSWRTPTWGQKDQPWREQRGHPGWFDEPMQATRAEATRAAHDAMEAMAARLAARTRST